MSGHYNRIALEHHNLLASLAADIRAAHAGVVDASLTRAKRAIAAGRALREAKALLRHGQWLPWLRDQCGLPVRTAQLYMKLGELSELGLTAEFFAEFGMNAASAVHIMERPLPDPFEGLDDAERREWLLFMAFGMHPDHVEWIVRKHFASPDEWLGDVGAEQRASWGYLRPRVGAGFIADWQAFRAEQEGKTLAEIEDEIRKRCVSAD